MIQPFYNSTTGINALNVTLNKNFVHGYIIFGIPKVAFPDRNDMTYSCHRT